MTLPDLARRSDELLDRTRETFRAAINDAMQRHRVLRNVDVYDSDRQQTRVVFLRVLAESVAQTLRLANVYSHHCPAEQIIILTAMVPKSLGI